VPASPNGEVGSPHWTRASSPGRGRRVHTPETPSTPLIASKVPYAAALYDNVLRARLWDACRRSSGKGDVGAIGSLTEEGFTYKLVETVFAAAHFVELVGATGDVVVGQLGETADQARNVTRRGRHGGYRADKLMQRILDPCGEGPA